MWNELLFSPSLCLCRRKTQAGSGGDGSGSKGGDGFRRGSAINTKQLADKKLRGRLEHTEALAEEAASSAAAAHQWLMPTSGGSLEAEGMERTWRFSQAAIVQGTLCHPLLLRLSVPVIAYQIA